MQKRFTFAGMSNLQAYLTLQLCLLACITALSIGVGRSPRSTYLSEAHKNYAHGKRSSNGNTKLLSSVGGQFDLSDYVKSELLNGREVRSLDPETNSRISGCVIPSFITLSSALELYSGNYYIESF